MKLIVTNDDPEPRGADTFVPPEEPIAVFAAAINSGNILSNGDMKASLLIPYEQIPNLMPVFKHVGGVVFKVTVERVDGDQLPEAGNWK